MMQPSWSKRCVEARRRLLRSSHSVPSQVLETALTADAATLTLSNQPRGGEMKAESLAGNTLADLGIT